MTNRPHPHLTLAAFAEALDIYGADRTRWPLDVRAGASGLLAVDRQAQRLYDEAVALDRMLDAAPVVDRVRVDRLVDRIVAAAERTPRVAATSVISARTPQLAGGKDMRAAASPRLSARLRSQGMAALAASLMLGILVGGSGISGPLVTALEDLTGLHLNSDAPALELARLGGETHDEDL